MRPTAGRLRALLRGGLVAVFAAACGGDGDDSRARSPDAGDPGAGQPAGDTARGGPTTGADAGGADVAPDARAPVLVVDGAPATSADGGTAPRWTCDSMVPIMEGVRPGFGRVCLEEVRDRAEWESISVPEAAGSELLRVTKLFLPVNDSAGIPPSFFDANSFSGAWRGPPAAGGLLDQPWHLIFASLFLGQHGPPMETYRGPGRVAYGGYVAEIEVQGVGRVFGYFIEDDDYPCETHKAVHAAMAKAFTLRPLYRSVFGPIPSPHKTPAGCDVPALVLK